MSEAELARIEERFPELSGRPLHMARMTLFQRRYMAVRRYASGIRFLRMNDGRTPDERETEYERCRNWLRRHRSRGYYTSGE